MKSSASEPGLTVWSGDFLGFWFLPPFDHPRHLKSGVPQPPGFKEAVGRNCFRKYGFYSLLKKEDLTTL